MNKKNLKSIILLGVIAGSILSSCSSENNFSVLKISDFKLSKDAFYSSYNIAPDILKFGSTPQRAYLNTIKNEYLVARHLIRQGFGKDSSLSKTLRLLRQELIVEKMFNEDVDSKIKISEEEILEEILKGNRQVKVKYIYTKDVAEAEEIKNDLSRGKSFEELQELKLIGYGLSSEAGETDFINYGEVHPRVNEVMFSLNPGEVSEIIQTETGYFIMKVVDVRKSILSKNDIARLTPTYKKILLNKRMNSEARVYIKQFMDPLNIVVNGKVFQKLVNTLYPEYKKNRQRNSVSLKPSQEFFKIEDYNEVLQNESLEKSLVNYEGGAFSVSEMLYHFSYYPASFPTTSIDEFASELKKRIGLRLRDIFLEKEGIKRGYHESKIITEELELWQNQIITYRYLQKLSDETIVDTTKLKKIYDEKFQNSLPFNSIEQKLVNSYKDYLIHQKLISIAEAEIQNHDFVINTELLNEEIELPATRLHAADVYSYKMGLPYSRLAFAVSNRIWAAENVWQSMIEN